MIKLEKQFKSGVGGFSSAPLTYNQIARNDKFAVYERQLDGKVKDFEVFHIKITPKGTQIFDKTIEEDTEHYPSTGDFGKTAWSYHGPHGKSAALKRFDGLSNPDTEVKKMTMPKGEFTIKDFAAHNKIQDNEARKYIGLAKNIKCVGQKRIGKNPVDSKVYIAGQLT